MRSECIVTVSVLALMTGWLPGCDGTKGGPSTPQPETWGLPRTSPANVISNLRQAFIERDSLHYAAQLADSFHFVFAPPDFDGTGDRLTEWHRVDDVVAMGRMSRGIVNLDGYVCDSIFLTWAVESAQVDTTYPGWTHVLVSNVFLSVETHKPDIGDPLDYLVRGDKAEMWFEKSDKLYRLIRWEDEVITGLGVEPSTFGQIKALWRQPSTP